MPIEFHWVVPQTHTGIERKGHREGATPTHPHMQISMPKRCPERVLRLGLGLGLVCCRALFRQWLQRGWGGRGLAQGMKKFSLWLFVLALSLSLRPPPSSLPLSHSFSLCFSVALCWLSFNLFLAHFVRCLAGCLSALLIFVLHCVILLTFNFRHGKRRRQRRWQRRQPFDLLPAAFAAITKSLLNYFPTNLQSRPPLLCFCFALC